MVIRVLKYWIPLAIATTASFGVIYLAVQQNYRLGANDPQIQIAEDVRKDIADGLQPQGIVLNRKIDLESSLAPFIILFDKDGNPINSSGLLNGQIPKPPAGVFAFAKSHGQDRFTWKPATNVRIAAVVVPYEGVSPGFLLAGRSLKEVEVRESLLAAQVLAGLGVTLLTTLAAVTFFEMSSLPKLKFKRINLKRLKRKKS